MQLTPIALAVKQAIAQMQQDRRIADYLAEREASRLAALAAS